MAKMDAFERYPQEYDQWYEDHPLAFEAELEAIKKLLPNKGAGLEVGVGTGRFAVALGIKTGVDPSQAMREIAKGRNIEVVDGVAEALPFPDQMFDYVLFGATVCFLDSIEQGMQEAWRVLKPGGVVVIGMIDRNSPLGQNYADRAGTSRFYRNATFRSVDEVVAALTTAGFSAFQFVQTLFHPSLDATGRVKGGSGEGGYVVIRALKQS